MKSLSPPDSHHLSAAQGWIEFKQYGAANEELEKIAPENRMHPDVLELRWQIYSNAKKWEACLDIATSLVELAPERAESWIHRSYTLHILKRTQEALDNLLPVAERFPGIWQIPYNLACYCSQLGRFEEAQSWFKKAIVLEDKIVPNKGIDDPDLKPLWDSMSTIIWKSK